MPKFNERLKSLRNDSGLSQKAFADELNISKSSINMYERGEREPSLEVLEAIADYFNVDMDFLLGKSDVKNKLMLSFLSGQNNNASKGIKIPVLGYVRAGVPIEAVEEILDYEEITESMARTGDFFALSIKGDSMEPKISEGDVVIVRKQEKVENGELAVVLVNGHDATVKKFYMNESGVTLISTNPAFEPFTFTKQEVVELPIRVIGKVVELRAKF